MGGFRDRTNSTEKKIRNMESKLEKYFKEQTSILQVQIIKI